MEPNHKLAESTSYLLDKPEWYRCLIGKLIYLILTHPELAYAVHTLALFMQSPRVDHWDTAHCVVRCLKGSPGQCIFLGADSPIILIAYSNYDWGSCLITRQPITGYFISFDSSPVS